MTAGLGKNGRASLPFLNCIHGDAKGVDRTEQPSPGLKTVSLRDIAPFFVESGLEH
jgi:hypothetical protein